MQSPAGVSSFTQAAVLTHSIVALAALVVVARSLTPGRRRAPDAAWGLWLAAALTAWATISVGACVLGAASTTGGGFTLLRFLAQVVFGEAPLLLMTLSIAHGRRRAPAALMSMGALALVLVYADAYHREPGLLQQREHVVEVAGGGPLRIAHLSDLQASTIGPHEERAWRTLAGSGADLIVLTGDYVQPRHGQDPAPLVAAFRRLLLDVPLHAPLGVWALQGDVERPGWRSMFEGTGIRTLQDEAVTLDSAAGPIRLVGLGARRSRARDTSVLRRLLEDDGPHALRIVAGHAPDFVDALTGSTPVDLVLAGHTHGGQVALPWIGPPMTLSRLARRHAGGLTDYHGVNLHVSRGVGLERGTAPQLRFNCPPEVCLLDVRPAPIRAAAAAAP